MQATPPIPDRAGSTNGVPGEAGGTTARHRAGAGPARPAPHRQHTRTFPGNGAAPLDRVRDWTQETATAWELPRMCAQDLCLVAYELAANALAHTRSRTEGLTLTLLQDRTGALTVEARDNGREDGAGPAIVADANSRWCDSGRGLVLVDGLSTWWVSEAVPGHPRLGHVVSARLHAPAAS